MRRRALPVDHAFVWSPSCEQCARSVESTVQGLTPFPYLNGDRMRYAACSRGRFQLSPETLCCGARTFEISCCGRGFCPPEVRAELQRSTLHRTDERRPLGSSHQHVLSLLPCVQAPPSASPEGPVVTSESRAPARSGLDALLSRPPSLVSRVSLRPATLVSFTHQRPNSTCPVHHCFLQLQIFVSCEQFGRWLRLSSVSSELAG